MKLYLENISLCLPNTDITRRFLFIYFFVFAWKELEDLT